MRMFEFKIARYVCRLLGHKWDEFHLHDVVCSRCRVCRSYTREDVANLAAKTRK